MQNDVGPSLIILGAAVSALALLQPNLTPLLALGLAAVTAGLLTAWEPAARERILAKLAEAGWENTTALIQAAGLPPKAYYIPSTIAGRPVAVVAAERPEAVPKGALTFKSKAGPAVVLSTPGTKAMELCGELPEDLAEALRSCVVNVLGLARSVSVAERPDGVVVVEYRRTSARDLYGNLLAKPALGGVVASITAAIAAEVLKKPVEIVEEGEAKGVTRVVLR